MKKQLIIALLSIAPALGVVAQDKLYKDEFPLGDITLLDGPLKHARDLKRPDWYVWIGHPDKDKRCYFKFVDFKSAIVTVDIGADAYVCFGSELPNNGQLPPLPEDVAEFLDGGQHGAAQSDDMGAALKAQANIKKKFDAMSIDLGGGVMLGASVWGKIKFDLGLIYGKLGAEAGVDVVVAKLASNAACTNLGRAPGFTGAGGSRWYARGQLYAYLYAKFGFHIYLGFWNGDIDLVDCGIGGGMIPKIQCCVDAVEQGVHRTHILDGRIPHSILTEMLSHKGIGTMIWE